MRIGERATAAARRRPSRRRTGGFTYIGLLLMIAITGALLAGMGTHWASQMHREREAELLFRGQALAEALARYARATPAGQPRRPQELQALLWDERKPGRGQAHLRRLWADPFTGRADWQLERDEQGGISGLRSRATAALRRRGPWPPGVEGAASLTPLVSDWLFSGDALSAPPMEEKAS